MKKYVLYIIIILLFASLISGGFSSCNETDYEKAEKEFRTWSKNDPNTWTDAQKEYFNNFLNWSYKN